MSEKEALIQKWDGFLGKIQERFDQFIAQAHQGTDTFIRQIEYDSISIGNAWNGIKSQMFSLSEKVTDTWDEKMDDLFGDRDDVTSEERIVQYYKGDDLKNQLSITYEKESTIAMANAGRKIYENVMKHIDLNKMHHCKQCGNKMDIQIYSFMAKNIKCQSCDMVNSYEPDARIQALEHYTITALANEQIIEEVAQEAIIQNEMHKLDQRKADEKAKLMTFREELTTLRKKRIHKFYDFITSQISDKAEFYNRKKEERLLWAEDYN